MPNYTLRFPFSRSTHSLFFCKGAGTELITAHMKEQHVNKNWGGGGLGFWAPVCPWRLVGLSYYRTLVIPKQ